MNKRLRFAIIFTAALALALSIFPLSAFLSGSSANAFIVYPMMSATITSPANGSTIREGSCFTLTALINVTCPSATELIWPARPVYAGAYYTGASNAAATISISGNAVLAAGQTAQVSLGNIACSGQATASWVVCCTGAGATTITVTPSGYSAAVVQGPGNLFDNIVKPVYAIPEPNLIPSEYIIPATITVYQAEKSRMFEDGSSSGSGSSQSYGMPAYTRITTAFVQPQQVLAGQPVTIMANVSNKGDLSGSYTATLMINNQVEATRKVTVPGNAAVPVQFSVTREKPGNYEADINGHKVYFTVTGEAAGSSIDPRIIVIAVIAVLVLLMIVLLIRRLSMR